MEINNICFPLTKIESIWFHENIGKINLNLEKDRRKEIEMEDAMSQEIFNAADYFIDRNIRQGRGHKVAIYTDFRNYTYNDIQKMVNKTAIH